MNKNYNKAKNISEKVAALLDGNEIQDDSELKRWIFEDNTSKEVVDLLKDKDKLVDVLKYFTRDEKYAKAQQLKIRIEAKRSVKRLRSRIYATVAALLAVSLFVWNSDRMFDSGIKVVQLSSTSNDAIIDKKHLNVESPKVVLPNGEEVDVFGLANRDTVNVAEIFSKNAISEDGSVKESKVCRIIVPRKFSLKVQLPDGTMVSLNAESELRYLENFSVDKREVTLLGEAFFDVAKSDIPFIVNCNGVSIRVYGTKFNINGYNKGIVQTALVEGTVGVSLINNSEFTEQVMVPNQLSVVNSSRGVSTITTTDLSQYVSWTRGFYRYDSRHIEDMLEELSRWYDTDFVYETQNLKSILVTASIKRDLNLDQILKNIEKVTKLKFIKEGGKYIVDSFQ